MKKVVGRVKCDDGWSDLIACGAKGTIWRDGREIAISPAELRPGDMIAGTATQRNGCKTWSTIQEIRFGETR